MAIPAPSRLEKFSWALFDFANSSFTTVVITVVYAPYFANVIATGRPLGLEGESLWGLALAASQVLVLLSAPILGRMADARASKKPYLFRSYLVCVLATSLLALTGPGSLWFALPLVIVANFAFSTGENVVAGFLPELASETEMGRLSGLAWAIGYLGGLASLMLALPLVAAEQYRWTCLTTAAFFGLAGIPTFLFLRERATPRPATETLTLARAAISELRGTWRDRHRFSDLFRFLGSILVFHSGITIVIAFAAIYAESEVGLSKSEVLWLFVGLQIAAGVGALAFGFLQDRVGSRRTLSASLVVWAAAVIAAWSCSRGDVWGFALAGCLAGAAMGGSQSASRALVGIMTPKGREAEWFGLWGMATKAAAVLGPLYFSLLLESLGRRAAMLSTLVPFGLGLAILLTVNVRRGTERAREASL